jgi:hypothetical protein
MSQQDSKFVSNKTLSLIQSLAQSKGYIEAIQQTLNLPPFDQSRINERAHWHYTNGPASFQDPYLLERSWIKAIGDALGISFEFEVDLLISSGPGLPKLPDNPT